MKLNEPDDKYEGGKTYKALEKSFMQMLGQQWKHLAKQTEIKWCLSFHSDKHKLS